MTVSKEVLLRQRVVGRNDVFAMLWEQENTFRDRLYSLSEITSRIVIQQLQSKFQDLFDSIGIDDKGYKTIKVRTDFRALHAGGIDGIDLAFILAFKEDNPEGELEIDVMKWQELRVKNPHTGFALKLEIRSGCFPRNFFTEVVDCNGSEAPLKTAATKRQLEFRSKLFSSEVSPHDIKNSIALIEAVQYLVQGVGLLK